MLEIRSRCLDLDFGGRAGDGQIWNYVATVCIEYGGDYFFFFFLLGCRR